MNDTAAYSNVHPSHYAGFWVRFFAACIDMVLYTPAYYAIMYVAGEKYKWWGEGFFSLFALVTYAWFFASRWQGSPGMYILKFHICDVVGRRISVARSLAWGVVGTVGWVVCLIGILYMSVKFDLKQIQDLQLSCVEQNIDPVDCATEIEKAIGIPYTTYQSLLFVSVGLALFLLVIWALSIALPKDKAGFNNILCGTRFIRGRPPAGGKEPMPAV